MKAGETIALVGESGAGKSTILNLVIGFHKADSGKVLIDGKDLSKIDLRTYRKHLAVVPQTSILFSGTIRDNITYGCENVSEEELQNVIKAANLSDLIASLPKGLDTMGFNSGSVLTGRTLPSEPSARHRYRILYNVRRRLQQSCQHPGSWTVCVPQ